MHDDLSRSADALREAATGAFERAMPGFVGDDAILHGVETRTSAPLGSCATMHAVRVLKTCIRAARALGMPGRSASRQGLRVARAVLGGHGSDVGAATGVEDPRRRGGGFLSCLFCDIHALASNARAIFWNIGGAKTRHDRSVRTPP